MRQEILYLRKLPLKSTKYNIISLLLSKKIRLLILEIIK